MLRPTRMSNFAPGREAAFRLSSHITADYPPFRTTPDAGPAAGKGGEPESGRPDIPVRLSPPPMLTSAGPGALEKAGRVRCDSAFFLAAIRRASYRLT